MRIMGMEMLLETIVLFLLLMIPGYLLGKTKLLPDETLPGIGNIIMYVAMPALVFLKLLQTDLMVLSATALVCSILLPIGLGLMLIFLSGFFFKGCDDARMRASRFCCAFPNCGFWSIPLACTLFPDKPEVAVYVSIFNVFSSFMLLTVGITVLSGDKRHISFRRVLTNPILPAILVGAALSHWNLVPKQVDGFATQLSQLATPLSMLVLGAEASKLKPKTLFANRYMYAACFVKLVLSPLVAMGVMLLLKTFLPVTDTLTDAMFLATAVSTALSAPTMAAKCGGDAEYAAVLTIGTTLLCAISMPLMYRMYTLFF